MRSVAPNHQNRVRETERGKAEEGNDDEKYLAEGEWVDAN
jgi:hypothetical protein